MGRPWLDITDFNIKLTELTNILDKQLETEIKLPSKNYELGNKAQNLLDYKYKDIFMNDYGEKVLDKNNNLIGYKLNDNRYITIQTYYNENNLLCNKVYVKDFDSKNLTFGLETFMTWTDIRTEFGFMREFNKIMYFYDHNNILFNIEKKFNYLSFPISKKDINLNENIGTLDFETYGDNAGFGKHQVYAGGWSIIKKIK